MTKISSYFEADCFQKSTLLNCSRSFTHNPLRAQHGGADGGGSCLQWSFLQGKLLFNTLIYVGPRWWFIDKDHTTQKQPDLYKNRGVWGFLSGDVWGSSEAAVAMLASSCCDALVKTRV